MKRFKAWLTCLFFSHDAYVVPLTLKPEVEPYPGWQAMATWLGPVVCKRCGKTLG